MRNIGLMFTGTFFCFLISACGSPKMDAGGWRVCADAGYGLDARVTECFEEVHAHFETLLQNPGDFQKYWDQFDVCGKLAAGHGRPVDDMTMKDLRECGAFIIGLECGELGEKLDQILIKKYKNVGQPSGCNTLFGRLRDAF